MQPSDFPKAFEALTGAPPFPWQSALYADFIAGRFPSSANLPTGLGKTAVIAIWLCALATKPESTPRRLIYVVNRRTVVDQTTGEVEKWRANLALAGLKSALATLCAVPLATDDEPLAISTLRGQFADNRAWSADLSRPAVIVGTVDMIGSRLLFSGYGSGFRTRPHHAAFIGQDTLIVHDEAHLEPAFQKLLASVETQQARDRDLRPLRVLALSATNRGNAPAFKLSEQDLNDSRIRQRIHAAKRLVPHLIDDEKKQLTEKLVALALSHRDSNRAVLIFARSLEIVQRVVTELEKTKVSPTPVSLTGTLRGWERDRLVEHPVFQRFLPPSSRVSIVEPIPTGTVYLVATSAGEVGVNLSADDLICDLSTFESMAQRFGRVNRFGELSDTVIDVVYPTSFDEKDPLSPPRKRTFDLLGQLQGNASPFALSELDPTAREAAFSPEPTILPATDILFDAWSLTTIRERLPGRPTVEAYLHGIAEWEPSETRVAWRGEVMLIDESLIPIHPPEELLADYPLKPHELLRDRSSRVHEQIKKLARRGEIARLRVWLLNEDGTVVPKTLGDLAEKEAERELHHRTLILPPSAGGLRKDGSLDGDAPANGTEDISDAPTIRGGSLFRQRIRSDTFLPNRAWIRDFRLVRTIDLQRSNEESDGEGDTPWPLRYWHWLESRQVIGGAHLQRSQTSVLLSTHTNDVERLATAIADKLRFPADLRRAIVLASRFHDAGKDRNSWQKSIGNINPVERLAKAGAHLRPRETGDHYRHEFGSLFDISAQTEFHALSVDEKDLVLHLIAAHHGRARPHFPANEVADSNAEFPAVQSMSADIPLRFARLQRRFGRWGLAYLESVLRAADYAASANPTKESA